MVVAVDSCGVQRIVIRIVNVYGIFRKINEYELKTNEHELKMKQYVLITVCSSSILVGLCNLVRSVFFHDEAGVSDYPTSISVCGLDH